jgi:integrase
MPKRTKQLPAVVVARFTQPGRHRVGGVSGLMLQVAPSGARCWILRTAIAHRRHDIGLGGYPDTGLAEARRKAQEFRDAIREGRNPLADRRDAQRRLAEQEANRVTFEECMTKFLAMKSAEWRNRKTDKQWKAALEAYANPVIGKLPVDQIDKAHIRVILEPIWTTKTVTATRVRGRIESILSWATHRGYRAGENPARWADNLEHELPTPSKVHAGGHFRALAIDDLPPFMAKLRAREGMAARALEFVILTAARSGEVRGARWDEIDLVKRLWSVPAARMKSNRAHTVPLSDAAIRVLKGVARSTANAELVFPAPRGGPLSDMALTAVLRRMNVDAWWRCLWHPSILDTRPQGGAGECGGFS